MTAASEYQKNLERRVRRLEAKLTESGQIRLSSLGQAVLTVDADTADNDSNAHPVIRLVQAGGTEVASITLNSSGDLVFSANGETATLSQIVAAL